MLTKLLTAARPGLEPTADDLVRRHGREIMAVARRYSSCREDAEDAYQRGLEILLTKAPSTRADDLVPWLKTVVKHEAFSLHRARERAGRPTPPERMDAGVSAPPEDHAERLERLQIGAEALGRLKPQEVRCMLLLAEGHSYKQICDVTGFSYTKVNRCLTEGRRSFLRRVEGIESGAECERLAPLLSTLADGEASAADMAALRPHLRSCLSCRATLRDAREVPARVAALAPIGLVMGAGPGGGPAGGLWSFVRSAWDAVGERLTWIAVRGHDVIETASAHKLAAAAASAAALGGGGIATVEMSGDGGGHVHRARPPVVAVARSGRAGQGPTRPRVTPWRPAAAITTPSRTVPRRHAQRRHDRVKKPHGSEPPVESEVTPTEPPLAAPEPAERQTQPTRVPSRRPARGTTGEFGP
jgi:RNA polymerase sigma factor (sigma-70 family)